MTADHGSLRSPPSSEVWPDLNYLDWRETALTLQLWTQIVGKVRVAATPWLNHSWHVALYVTAAGLGTSPIHIGMDVVEIEFDFLADVLVLRTGRGRRWEIPLRSQPVSGFYRNVLTALEELGLPVVINAMPNEIPDPIAFPDDHVHSAYDPGAARRFWRALVQVDRVFKLFRTGFLGKCSPVHFFWGSFDLAVTRFSGRRAPPHPGGVPHLPDAVVREAYSHEVSSAGFWPGGEAFPQAAFYAYAYPEPPGFRNRPVQPSAASFNAELGEFILPYDAVRAAAAPDDALLAFLQSTYDAAADAGGWDRAALECAQGSPRLPRPTM
jgi:Family of unknown function (DUF5996)